MNDKFTVSKQFALHSSSATLKRNGSYLSDVFFSIPGFVRSNLTDANFLYSTISIKTSSFPNVFYNVDLYRLFSVTIYSQDQQQHVIREIRAGYYDVYTLVEELNTLFENILVFSFDEVVQLLNVKSTGANPLFAINETVFSRQLGFDGASFALRQHTAKYMVDLSVDSFFILLDEKFNSNINMKIMSNYYEQVPLPLSFGEIIYYSSKESRIQSEDAIEGINIRFTDINGNLVNFRGQDWQVTFEIISYYRKSFDTNTPEQQLQLFLQKIFELLTLK